MTEIKRGPGRPPKPKEPTAIERIAALNVRRAAGNGYIIAPPEPLTALSFRAWLHAVAEEGSPGDVEIAWHFCNNTITKGQLRNEYDALRDAAGRRHHALEAAAERERQAEWAASERLAEMAKTERTIAGHKAEIERLEALLASM